MARKVSLVLSHWYHLVEGLQESPQSFYSALQQSIEKRNLPNTKISRITYKESGIFSSKREYLRVSRKEHLFDVCAAPFGNGFFVSWWLALAPGAALETTSKIPIIGPLFFNLFKPATYFAHDTALMFQESIRTAVNEVIDGNTQAKGLRMMSELERKPILSNLFQQ